MERREKNIERQERNIKRQEQEAGRRQKNQKRQKRQSEEKVQRKRTQKAEMQKERTQKEETQETEKSQGVWKKNDSVTLTIESLGAAGEGIGKVEGYTLFVKDAVPGDRIHARIVKVKKQYGYARLEELLQPSPDRIEPRCPVARQCGGCQLQHLSYEKQLEYKQHKVADCLARIGGLGEGVREIMEPICGMAHPWHYRNKAQFPVGYRMEREDAKKKEAGRRLAIGFYAGRTHTIIDAAHCYIQAEVNEQIVEIIREFLEEYQIPAYEEESGRGLVRHILTRVGFATGEIGICLVVNGRELPHQKELCRRLTKLEGVCSICLNVNQQNTNVILGEELIPLFGEPYIRDFIGEVQFQISPLSFYQVNPVQTRVLYGKALEYAGLTGQEVVWDLYCGIGTISLFLAKRAKAVYGVEIVPAAVEDARRNAKLNGIENAYFTVGAAEEVAPRLERPDVIVVDPPRKGCDEKLLETILSVRPERVVYVSCDPGTLGRDIKVLTGGGYGVERVQVVDMFGWGYHAESIVLLSKLHTKQNIEVKLEMSELDLTAAESKATYEEIKDYVLEHMGLKVSSLYIAQVKQKCGIIERENYNLSKSENSRQPKCPPEKEKAIRDALEYFKMV